MVNWAVAKEFIAFALAGSIPIAAFLGVMFFYQNNVIYAAGGTALAICIMYLIGSRMISHPYSEAIKGKGWVCLAFDSYANLSQYILKRNANVLTGVIDGKEVKTEFDRRITMKISPPDQADYIEDGTNMFIRLPKNIIPNLYFVYGQFNALIFNRKLNTFMDKNSIANQEYKYLTQHGITELNARVEQVIEYSSAVRKNFASKFDRSNNWLGLLSNPWVWIVIGIIVVIFVVMIAPQAMQTLGAASGETSKKLAADAALISTS